MTNQCLYGVMNVDRPVLGRMTQFSVRLLFVVAMVVAAYAGGRASMERRARLAELDAAAVRLRASDLESRLKSAHIENVSELRKRLVSNWAADRRPFMNKRWVIETPASDEYEEAARLDLLGIKLIAASSDGASFYVVSKLASRLTVETCQDVPPGSVMIEATGLDQLLLLQADLPQPISGVARLLPVQLADALLRAELAFTSGTGLRPRGSEKFRFNVFRSPLGGFIATATTRPMSLRPSTLPTPQMQNGATLSTVETSSN